jgi:hypothetical protein
MGGLTQAGLGSYLESINVLTLCPVLRLECKRSFPFYIVKMKERSIAKSWN